MQSLWDMKEHGWIMNIEPTNMQQLRGTVKPKSTKICNASRPLSCTAQVGVVQYVVLSVSIVKADHTPDVYRNIPGHPSVVGP